MEAAEAEHEGEIDLGLGHPKPESEMVGRMLSERDEKLAERVSGLIDISGWKLFPEESAQQ